MSDISKLPARQVDQSQDALAGLAREVLEKAEKANDDDFVKWFSSTNGAAEVWRSWKDNMLAQCRNVTQERLNWDTLPQIDKELDAKIAYDVISDFLFYIKTHPHEWRDAAPALARAVLQASDLSDAMPLREMAEREKRLREALEIFANTDNWLYGGCSDSGYPDSPDWCGDDDEPWKIAQLALAAGEQP